MKIIKVLFLVVFMIGLQSVYSQNRYEGKIMSKKNGAPVPFANITFGENMGVVSDIDGLFEITSIQKLDSVSVSCIGYVSQRVKLIEGKRTLVKMDMLLINLDEVEIFAGDNSAMRIVRGLSDQLRSNRLDNYNNYRFKAYDKLLFTIKGDSIVREAEASEALESDSLLFKKEDWFNSYHLFISENVTSVRYQKPGKKQEEVKAIHTSGITMPLIALLLSQMQSQDFYEKTVSLMGKNYPNPFHSESLSRYWYCMEDTIIYGKADTAFLISYYPKRGMKFDGFQGSATIRNKNGWAFQNVTARIKQSNDKEAQDASVLIEQNYHLVDSIYWFPSQLNTVIEIPYVQIDVDSLSESPLIGKGTRYIFDVHINETDVKPVNASVKYKFADNAMDVDEDLFNLYRREEITEQDRNTFHFLDSISKEMNFDGKLFFLREITSGAIPIGKLSIDYRNLYSNNSLEGSRWQLGLKTNKRFSKRIFFGGYYAYGMRDKGSKYGFDASLGLDRFNSHRLSYHYINDLETSKSDFFFLQSNNTFVNPIGLLLHNVNAVQRHKVTYSGRPFAGLQIMPSIEIEQYFPQFNYAYGNFSNPVQNITLLEASFQMQYCYGEGVAQLPDEEIVIKSDYPILSFAFYQGIPASGWGDASYQRILFGLQWRYSTNFRGTTSMNFIMGYASDQVPMQKMFTRGGYQISENITYYSDNDFVTMHSGEFYNHRFASVHLRYDSKKPLVWGRIFAPEISLTQNVLFGNLHKDLSMHHNVMLKDTPKGYFETGCLFNNVLKTTFMNYGVGIHYRWGEYSNPKPLENIFLSIIIGL